MRKNFFNFRIALASIWLMLTSALTLWWMIFAMSLIKKVDQGHQRHEIMLYWEGATLLGLLLIGGGLLIYYINREKAQTEQLRLFFAAFTHDVKTRLSGVKLQIESIKADNTDSNLSVLVNRLLTDASRLQVQVENSLYIGGGSKSGLIAEKFSLASLVHFLTESWPQLQIDLKTDVHIFADKKAFENVITNLLHNSISHGQASRVTVDAHKIDEQSICVTVSDNGKGFDGECSKLGEKFYRHNPSSGSGLGLFTVRESIKKMNGQINFITVKNGFCVNISVPGKVTSAETISGKIKSND